jgi:hypothetical protein
MHDNPYHGGSSSSSKREDKDFSLKKRREKKDPGGDDKAEEVTVTVDVAAPKKQIWEKPAQVELVPRDADFSKNYYEEWMVN